MNAQELSDIAQRTASRISIELREPTLPKIVESELEKLKSGESESTFEANTLEKISLSIAIAAFILQAISTGIDWKEHSQSQLGHLPSSEQIAEVIEQKIPIDKSIPPEQQTIIIQTVAEEIITQTNQGNRVNPQH